MNTSQRKQVRVLTRRLRLYKTIKQQINYANSNAVMNNIQSIRSRILDRLEERLELYNAITDRIGIGPSIGLDIDNNQFIVITK